MNIKSVSIILLAFTGAFCSPSKKNQSFEPVKDTAVVVKADTTILTDINDSASYAIGISVANFYKQQGIKNLNTTLISKAINDIMSGKKPLMDDGTANNVMNNYMTRVQEEKSKATIEAGEKFLAQNKTKPGVKTTESGLQYEVLREGTGERPNAADSVTVHYLGTFLNGEEFDGSYKRGQPITFILTGVIRGWTEGLQLMTVGSKYKFYIPYSLGYGVHDYMSIPGGSMLTFEVELLAVKKN